MKAIAYSYWRRIKDGARAFDATPENIIEDVDAAARQEVADCVITKEQYEEITGKTY